MEPVEGGPHDQTPFGGQEDKLQDDHQGMSDSCAGS